MILPMKEILAEEERIAKLNNLCRNAFRETVGRKLFEDDFEFALYLKQ